MKYKDFGSFLKHISSSECTEQYFNQAQDICKQQEGSGAVHFDPVFVVAQVVLFWKLNLMRF